MYKNFTLTFYCRINIVNYCSSINTGEKTKYYSSKIPKTFITIFNINLFMTSIENMQIIFKNNLHKIYYLFVVTDEISFNVLYAIILL
jgi:hypothetical protein